MVNSKFYACVFLLLLAGNLAALDSVFGGIGPEANGYTRSGIAAGNGFVLGLDLNSYFAVGIRAFFFDNFESVNALEPLLFFRYYLPSQYWPGNTDGPFIQAEPGGVFFLEYGELFPAFSGSLAVGWRLSFSENGYVEPALRAGYPHIWGVNITAGVRIPP